MAKDDSAPGLLSKMVKFVRNPLTNWSELDEPELDKESKYSKQMLKEMIERKRRNDFVRRREFDQLRKLRRREPLSATDAAGRPSFFQSSMPSTPDDRAVTLKKIDEIEAQMSMQWWKTKHAGDAAHAASAANAANAAGFRPSGAAPVGLAPGAAASELPSEMGRTYAPTEPVSLSVISRIDSAQPYQPEPLLDPGLPLGAAAAPVAEDHAGAPAGEPRAARGYDGTPSGFTSSKLMGPSVPSFVHDPELEEAAIRFANGDNAGAESGLREALTDPQRALNEETWLTLFDLYRATGQHDAFDGVAIDFAGRFGRSAPLWFSLPEVLNQPTQPATGGPSANGYLWNCPDILGQQSVAALQAALAKAAEPWRLNWSRLVKIDEAALEPLARLFTDWCARPVQVGFVAAERLADLLRAATPSGDRSVPQGWWRLRTEFLRLSGRSDEFELAALDFCVTYEVSPPSWQNVRCTFLVADGLGNESPSDFALVEEGPPSVPSSGLNLSDSSDLQTIPLNVYLHTEATAELAGQVVGDAAAELAALDASLEQGGVKAVSVICDKLARVDFSAAGSVLNWVAARQADGVEIQFRDMHRLVAIFFNVIGINEHAKVFARTD